MSKKQGGSAAPEVDQGQQGQDPAVSTPPTTEQLAQSPNWGQGGSYIINERGERVPANQE